MKEFGKDNFDRAIRAKFKDTAFEPSSHVWEGIETELLRTENSKMRKKALWYRNLAASVILIAMVSIYFNVIGKYDFSQEKDQFTQLDLVEGANTFLEQASNLTESPSMPLGSSSSDLTEAPIGAFSESQKSIVKSTSTGLALNDTGGLGEYVKSKLSDLSIISISNDGEEQRKLELLVKGAPNTATASNPLRADLDKVSYFAISETEEKPKEHNAMNFVADLSFGSGTFNPNAQVTGNSSQLNAIVSNSSGGSGRNTSGDNYEAIAVQEYSSAPMEGNLSLSYGVSFGVNIGKRLLMKSGLQYGNYRSTSESSAVVRDLNSDQLYPFHGASSTARVAENKVINITSPYNLYNDFEILSVPLQITYNLLNTKLGIGITAGITTDFLLSNTLTGASDQINAIKFTQQDRNSYKSVFASSLIGLDFTYALGEHYGLSLSPQYKKALTDVTNASTDFKSTPAFASINMSFQYIF